jgi:hypothetical protein
MLTKILAIQQQIAPPATNANGEVDGGTIMLQALKTFGEPLAIPVCASYLKDRTFPEQGFNKSEKEQKRIEGYKNGANCESHAAMIVGQKTLSASPLGSPSTVTKMLEFCQRHSIKPTCEFFPFSKINDALERLRSGKARYRIVLQH